MRNLSGKKNTGTIMLISVILFTISLQAHELDSNVFIKELQNSSTSIFNACIKKYDDYIKLHPDDVTAQIEKCKFLQNAEYNENEEYNPHQEAFDSCKNALVNKYPEHPEVLLFQTSFLWGEELKSVYEKAEKAMHNNPDAWSKENRSLLFKSASDYYFNESDFKEAQKYILRAIDLDEKYRNSFDYARILFELKKNKECLRVLLSEKDTTKDAWKLSQKADLYMQLKEYSKAVELFNRVNKIDTLFADNLKLAATFEGLKKFDLARKYLIADTLLEWKKEAAFYQLFIHDLKYQKGSFCIESYNKFRDTGFGKDPLGLYRLKVFFKHPFQWLKFRDIVSLLLLLLTIVLLVLIPSVWILPFYFAGHKWRFLEKPKPFVSEWGLKSFWFVSVGILFASFTGYFINPEILYSAFSSDISQLETPDTVDAFISMVFFVIICLVTVAVFYKVSPKVFIPDAWSLKKSIFTSLGILLLFRIVTGIYIKVGISHFGLSIEDVTCFKNIFLSTQQDIQNLITTYGKGITFLFICIIVPVYEEIIFRGVILGSAQRYTNFNIANVFQALVFSLLHLNLYLIPVFFIFGIIAGSMRKKSGGLMPGIVFHIGNNVLATILIMIR